MFDTLNKTQLKKIIRYYNLHQMIRNYSKMTIDELRIALKKVVHIDEDYNIYLHPRGTDNLLSGSETKTLIKYRDPNAPKKKRGKAPEAPKAPLKIAPYYFYEDLDKTIREYIRLNSTLDEKHFRNQIKEYENELKYLENRKLKSAKSIEENNDKISNAKIYLNSYKEKLDDIPNNKISMEYLLTLFEQKYRINFNDFISQLDEDIDSIRNMPYWSLYNSDHAQKLVNKIYNNLNSDDLEFIIKNKVGKKRRGAIGSGKTTKVSNHNMTKSQQNIYKYFYLPKNI